MTFAELRKGIGLKQEDIARHVSIDRSSVARWETGISQPTIDKIPLLAKLLGVTEGEIIAAIAASKNEKQEDTA